ncbi:hypothetical protein [Thalassobius sp. I31.1]|uniref:hypothetical protein n=1 Tax=Thalassobius sp. I31.1 TaxID=2109912 RepID=UPI000D1AC641|nr:hypothetical protein [Thalassobius sp. I31.1]
MKNKSIHPNVSPGKILHEVISGALKAQGTSFWAWCQAHEVSASTAKQVTYGQSGGERGQALLAQMIEAAGPDVVLAAYRKRMQAEAAGLEGAAA